MQKGITTFWLATCKRKFGAINYRLIFVHFIYNANGIKISSRRSSLFVCVFVFVMRKVYIYFTADWIDQKVSYIPMNKDLLLSVPVVSRQFKIGHEFYFNLPQLFSEVSNERSQLDLSYLDLLYKCATFDPSLWRSTSSLTHHIHQNIVHPFG